MGRLDPPLSPHISVYRWQVGNTLSFLHRFTGVMLTLAAVILTVWLVAMASGPGSYLRIVGWLGSPVGMLLLFGWTFCFFYHLCNGIRHLVWDAGYGFEPGHARASGLAVVAAAVVLTVIFWLVVVTGGGS